MGCEYVWVRYTTKVVGIGFVTFAQVVDVVAVKSLPLGGFGLGGGFGFLGGGFGLLDCIFGPLVVEFGFLGFC